MDSHRRPRVAAAAILFTMVSALVTAIGPAPAQACSPLFDPPTIQDLGPAQLVVIGTTGDRVANGRLFHVDRWFNGGVPTTPIVITFKEGEATGDCSYPVAAGTRLIIAPTRLDDGSLYADLVTLQADPDSDAGRAYVAEAVALFGPGVVPAPAPVDPADPARDDVFGWIAPIVLGASALGAVAAAAFLLAGRRHRPGGRRPDQTRSG